MIDRGGQEFRPIFLLKINSDLIETIFDLVEKCLIDVTESHAEFEALGWGGLDDLIIKHVKLPTHKPEIPTGNVA